MKRAAAEIDAVVAALTKHGVGGVNPTVEQLRALLVADRDGPLHFVNLLSYRELAQYPAGHEMASRKLTGEQAYGLYGQVALKHVLQRGGRLVTWNGVEQAIIGADTSWHHVATMEYRSTDAFIEMVTDPEYDASLVHRDAGLAKTLVLVTRPLLPAK